jgi:hypothetical protein
MSHRNSTVMFNGLRGIFGKFWRPGMPTKPRIYASENNYTYRSHIDIYIPRKLQNAGLTFIHQLTKSVEEYKDRLC